MYSDFVLKSSTCILLSCLFSCLSFVVYFVYFLTACRQISKHIFPRFNFREETLHTCTRNADGKIQDHTDDIEDADTEKLQNTEGGASNSWLSLLLNWPLMSTIIVYCVFQLHDMAYIEIFSLWTVSPRTVGGLSLSTEDVGQALAVAGVGLLFCQLLLYPFLERKLGPITVSRVGAVLSIVLLSSYPFFAKLRGTSLSLVVDLASLLKNVLSVSITTGLFLLQNRAVNQHQRGAANGLSLCIMSFCKALGPAAAGSLLSWGQMRRSASFLPGTHLVFFILNVVELLGFLMTFKPFLAKPAHEYC